MKDISSDDGRCISCSNTKNTYSIVPGSLGCSGINLLKMDQVTSFEIKVKKVSSTIVFLRATGDLILQMIISNSVLTMPLIAKEDGRLEIHLALKATSEHFVNHAISMES